MYVLVHTSGRRWSDSKLCLINSSPNNNVHVRAQTARAGTCVWHQLWSYVDWPLLMIRRFGVASAAASSVSASSSSELIIFDFWSIVVNASLQLLLRAYTVHNVGGILCLCMHIHMHHSKRKSQSQWPKAQTSHSFTGKDYKMAIAKIVSYLLPQTSPVSVSVFRRRRQTDWRCCALRWRRRDDVAVEVLTYWFDVTIDNVTFGLDDVNVDAVVRRFGSSLVHLRSEAFKTPSSIDVYTLHFNMYMYMPIYIHIHEHSSVHTRMHVQSYNDDDKIKIQNALMWVHVLQELWKDPHIS